MGANMARHLQIDCGHDVTAVYDINTDAAGELAAELDAKKCDKLADVAEAADVIITVVTNDAAMEAIVDGGFGALSMNKLAAAVDLSRPGPRRSTA